jgi:hypothetical protein
LGETRPISVGACLHAHRRQAKMQEVVDCARNEGVGWPACPVPDYLANEEPTPTMS